MTEEAIFDKIDKFGTYIIIFCDQIIKHDKIKIHSVYHYEKNCFIYRLMNH